MVDINQEETQQELFTEFAGALRKQERFIPQSKVNRAILLNTSVEQLILGGIALILLCCFVFFLGVLRGKSLSILPKPVVMAQKKAMAIAPIVQKSLATPSMAIAKEMPVAATSVKLTEATNFGKPYTIQVSTYRRQDLAEKEAVTLRRSGYHSTIISSDSFCVVCVGQYATKDEAKKDLKILGAKYKGSFLRRR